MGPAPSRSPTRQSGLAVRPSTRSVPPARSVTECPQSHRRRMARSGETQHVHHCAVKEGPNHFASRRNFLKGAAATGVAAAALNLFAARPATAHDDDSEPPRDSGRPGRRYLIRGGSIMSMDPTVGDLVRGDVLVEGKKILAIGPNLSSGSADVIDARGRIVMPGFIDTHHHQFETALRSFLANGILINDGSGSPSADPTYFEYILLKVRAGVPAAGRLHQRAVRRAGAARQRRHHGARHLADPSLAAALRRGRQGADRYRPPRRARLFRERRRRCRATSIRPTRPASSSSGSRRPISSPP